ncbi:hypothetical protein QKT49_gp376 [Acanthamoeba castellanii medusavirus]|uniref:Uncharacterized protein n=1 Tax=Acanthamoeba castellanii medusavirus J1 TaxID=3114988 RepID=A0A3T1CX27_9VIRU|nr:hypothetical protein QKT49_gp376 [Acanthamoeba castellanii medusavirus]BBI30387.1 hypothetical protein [Acanthamoeba castellanii medusavirus J1]
MSNFKITNRAQAEALFKAKGANFDTGKMMMEVTSVIYGGPERIKFRVKLHGLGDGELSVIDADYTPPLDVAADMMLKMQQ